MTAVGDSPWLGWNPVEVYRGASVFQPDRHRLDLGWQPGDIRNCSYATPPPRIGITAEDRTGGGQVLAIHEPESRATRVLLREDRLLHHALSRSGSKVCYCVPSRKPGSADLYLYELPDGKPGRLLEGVVAQASTPAWFPNDSRIAYHSVEGRIEILDLESRQRTMAADGEHPAVSPNGERIAYRQGGELFVWQLAGRQTLPIARRRGLWKRPVTVGPSWAPNGSHLLFGVTAGLVGKETVFYLLDTATGQARKTSLRYLTGLLLVDVSAERKA